MEELWKVVLVIITISLFWPAKIKAKVCFTSGSNVTKCHLQNENDFQVLKNLSTDIISLTIRFENNSNDYLNFDPELLRSFKNLSILEVKTNHLENVVFKPDSNLTSFDSIRILSFTKINFSTENVIISNLSNLECLRITECKLEVLETSFLKGLCKLIKLYMVKNNLRRIEPFALQDSYLLRRLSLSHNEIVNIQADSLAGLIYLEVLDLSSNKIDHISTLSFPDLPNLVRLELSMNPIKVIMPASFKMMHALKLITLGHAQQGTFITPFSFNDLSNLTYLFIPKIDNEVLEKGTFLGLTSLWQLRLRGNIENLGDYAFDGLGKSLKALILNNCCIKWVTSTAFRGLELLTTLDLSSNKLESLNNETFRTLYSLQELILADNLFSTLPVDIFKPILIVKSIRLDSNPWDCSCAMKYWDKKVVLRITTRVQAFSLCDANSSICVTTMSVDFKYSEEIIPFCKTPVLYEGVNVFSVLESNHFDC